MSNPELVEVNVIGEKKLLVPISLKRIFDNYEELSVSYLKNLLVQGDVFIDVGANFGFYTVLASAIVGETGKVISVEASPSTLTILKTNVGGLGNVRISPYAISNRTGEIDFYHTDDYVNSGSVENPPFVVKERVKKLRVRSRRLDDILRDDFELEVVNFLKIDVQGDDLDVLESCAEVLANSDDVKVLIEWAPTWMINAGRNASELPRKLKDLGFSKIVCVDDWLKKAVSVEEFYRSYEEDKAGKRYCNVLAIR